jgi:flagellar protein FliT
MPQEQFDQDQDQDQVRLVERVFELTQAMKDAASIADWQYAARLGDERSPLLRSIRANQRPESLELIQRIQAIGETITQEAAIAQSELAAEYRGAMERIGTVRAYHSVALL